MVLQIVCVYDKNHFIYLKSNDIIRTNVIIFIIYPNYWNMLNSRKHDPQFILLISNPHLDLFTSLTNRFNLYKIQILNIKGY